MEEGKENSNFVEREWNEEIKGHYDKDGFFITPNGSFWDPDGVYFNRNGRDKHNGYYDDNGEYIPGKGWDEINNCYESEKEYDFDSDEEEYDEIDDKFAPPPNDFNDYDDILEGEEFDPNDKTIEKIVQKVNITNNNNKISGEKQNIKIEEEKINKNENKNDNKEEEIKPKTKKTIITRENEKQILGGKTVLEHPEEDEPKKENNDVKCEKDTNNNNQEQNIQTSDKKNFEPHNNNTNNNINNNNNAKSYNKNFRNGKNNKFNKNNNNNNIRNNYQIPNKMSIMGQQFPYYPNQRMPYPPMAPMLIPIQNMPPQMAFMPMPQMIPNQTQNQMSQNLMGMQSMNQMQYFQMNPMGIPPFFPGNFNLMNQLMLQQKINQDKELKRMEQKFEFELQRQKEMESFVEVKDKPKNSNAQK